MCIYIMLYIFISRILCIYIYNQWGSSIFPPLEISTPQNQKPWIVDRYIFGGQTKNKHAAIFAGCLG